MESELWELLPPEVRRKLGAMRSESERLADKAGVKRNTLTRGQLETLLELRNMKPEDQVSLRVGRSKGIRRGAQYSHRVAQSRIARNGS